MPQKLQKYLIFLEKFSKNDIIMSERHMDTDCVKVYRDTIQDNSMHHLVIYAENI